MQLFKIAPAATGISIPAVPEYSVYFVELWGIDDFGSLVRRQRLFIDPHRFIVKQNPFYKINLARMRTSEFLYNEAFRVMRDLRLPHHDFVQLYKRMIFNEYAKNYDDHTKNIAFLMDKKGVWSLAPAFDMTFSYRKDSIWVCEHQMLINGKSTDIKKDDLLAAAIDAGIKKGEAAAYEEQVLNAISKWSSLAETAGVSEEKAERIKKQLPM